MCALSSAPRSATSPAVTAVTTAIHSSPAGAARASATRRRAPSADGAESVANSRLRDDELRPDRVALDLAAQVRHVHAQVRLRVPGRVAPHLAEDLPVRERA